jgi:ribosomal protein S17E
VIEAPAVISESENEKMVAVNSLIAKVEGGSDFANRNDIVDLLKDLRSKIGRNEILPNYITKDIKNYLGEKPEFKEDVEKLLVILKK